MACPSISETTLGLTFLESSSVAQVCLEVVEAHGVGETGLLEEGLEVAAVEVVAVDGRADLRGED